VDQRHPGGARQAVVDSDDADYDRWSNHHLPLKNPTARGRQRNVDSDNADYDRWSNHLLPMNNLTARGRQRNVGGDDAERSDSSPYSPPPPRQDRTPTPYYEGIGPGGSRVTTSLQAVIETPTNLNRLADKPKDGPVEQAPCRLAWKRAVGTRNTLRLAKRGTIIALVIEMATDAVWCSLEINASSELNVLG
jgi:hypothetical protein